MSIVRIDPEGRRNAEHIAIIVVVDLVPIQSHLDSGNFSATNISDDGHRPIHFISSNPTGMTATGPALRPSWRGCFRSCVPSRWQHP